MHFACCLTWIGIVWSSTPSPAKKNFNTLCLTGFSLNWTPVTALGRFEGKSISVNKYHYTNTALGVSLEQLLEQRLGPGQDEAPLSILEEPKLVIQSCEVFSRINELKSADRLQVKDVGWPTRICGANQVRPSMPFPLLSPLYI